MSVSRSSALSICDLNSPSLAGDDHHIACKSMRYSYTSVISVGKENHCVPLMSAAFHLESVPTAEANISALKKIL